MTENNLASYLEHTLLGENITHEQIQAHITESMSLGVYGVCIPMQWIPLAKNILGTREIKLVTVIDFPLGNLSPHEKAKQAFVAQSLGAQELDLVLDYNQLKARDYHTVYSGIKAVIDETDLIVKIIVETSALTHDELVSAITLVGLSGAQFIKTSTGFHNGGARVEDIMLMRRLLPNNTKIKASGGIKTQEQALNMINAGADRIGASRSRNILEGKS